MLIGPCLQAQSVLPNRCAHCVYTIGHPPPPPPTHTQTPHKHHTTIALIGSRSCHHPCQVDTQAINWV